MHNSKMRQPWGTITHPKERNPENLLGYQKVSRQQISELTSRLYQEDWLGKREEKRERSLAGLRKDKMGKPERKRTAGEVEEIVKRLTHKAERNVTDSNRTGSMKEMGILNTFACKGWN